MTTETTEKRSAVFGVYANRDAAELAAQALVDVDFPRGDISILAPAAAGAAGLAHEEQHPQASEGTAGGAVAGGAVGGAIGLLVGAGSLAIPGLGPLVAIGPLLATFAGVGAGGAVGGLLGALTGLGISEFEAARYESCVKAGGLLLSVRCDTSADVRLAIDILKRTGAEDIATTDDALLPDPSFNPISFHPDL